MDNIDTALNNLHDGIDRRIESERRYIVGIKDALVAIIRNMTECVNEVNVRVSSGNISDTDRNRLNDRILDATRKLRQMDPMNPRNIVEPFRRYATNNIKNNDPNKGTAAIVGRAPRTLSERVFGRSQPAQAPRAQAPRDQAPRAQNLVDHPARESLDESRHSGSVHSHSSFLPAGMSRTNSRLSNSDEDDVFHDTDVDVRVHDVPELFTDTPKSRTHTFGGWKQNRSKRIRSKRVSKRR